MILRNLSALPPVARERYGGYLIPTEETGAGWANLIRAEYCEMPGLSLTEQQVVRLWRLDRAFARLLLVHLVDAGFLRRTPNGLYVRADT